MPFDENMLQKTRELIERDLRVPADLQNIGEQNANAELYSIKEVKDIPEAEA